MILETLAVVLLVIGYAVWQRYPRRSTADGAPFVPLEPEIVNRVMDLAKVGKDDVFYDLGSGDGRLVINAAWRGAKSFGVEIDPARVWYSRILIFLARLSGRAHILQKNIFDVDLSNATVVHLYLLQQTNDQLQRKLERELKPGTRVVSTAFDFFGWKPETIDPRGPIYGPIYVYKR